MADQVTLDQLLTLDLLLGHGDILLNSLDTQLSVVEILIYCFHNLADLINLILWILSLTRSW